MLSNLGSEMPPGAEFAEVLTAAQAGESWALGVLYRDFHPAVYRYLWSRCPNDAEDVASEVWLGVATSIQRFSGDESDFRRWIFTIARRRLIDFQRRRVKRSGAGIAITPDTPALDDPEAQATDQVQADHVLSRLISVLSPEQAEVVVLRIVGGLSVQDVADIVGKRPVAVRALQHRALVRLARTVSREDITL